LISVALTFASYTGEKPPKKFYYAFDEKIYLFPKGADALEIANKYYESSLLKKVAKSG